MSERSLDGLGDHISQVLGEWRVPGAAIAVVRGDDVCYLRGHGVKEVGGGDRVDEHTLFEIGSTSKAFTATAIGMLVDDGLVRWDDPVVDHLPEFRLHDPWLTTQVTVRDTLAHRAGFVDFWSPGLEIMGTDEALRRMRHRVTFDSFRDSYNYSNVMYGVAGKVVEMVSGVSWGDFLKARVFEPLGMTRSRTSAYDLWDEKYVAPTIFGTAPAGVAGRRDARDANVAMPHELTGAGARVIPWQSYDFLAGAGAVISSAADLSNWLTLQVNKGTANGRRLVQKDTMAEIHAPQNWKCVGVFPFDEGANSYAMGWNRGRYRGRTHLSHGGGMRGFPAYVSVLPGERLGVAVLANADGTTFEAAAWGRDAYAPHKCIALTVFDLLIDAPARDWRQEFAQRSATAERRHEAHEKRLHTARRSNRGPTLPLADYAGDYVDRTQLHGPVRVDVGGGTLRLVNPGPGAFVGILDHWHGDLFRLRSTGVGYVSPFVRFVVGADGRVESMSAFDGDFRPQSAAASAG